MLQRHPTQGKLARPLAVQGVLAESCTGHSSISLMPIWSLLHMMQASCILSCRYARPVNMLVIVACRHSRCLICLNPWLHASTGATIVWTVQHRCQHDRVSCETLITTLTSSSSCSPPRCVEGPVHAPEVHSDEVKSQVPASDKVLTRCQPMPGSICWYCSARSESVYLLQYP